MSTFTVLPTRHAVGLITLRRSKGGMSAAPTSCVEFKSVTIRPSLVKAAWSQNVGKVTLIKSGPRKASSTVMASMLAELAANFKR